MSIYQILFGLVIVIIVGMIFGHYAQKLKLPTISGYCLAGVLIGPSLLNIINEEILSSLSVISDVALAFIAFTIGMELWRGKLKKSGKDVIIITIVQALVTAVITAIGVFVFTIFTGEGQLWLALILGAIATATAPGPLVMLVKQFQTHGPLTQRLLPIVGLDDAVGVMVFAIFVSIAFALKLDGGSLNVQNMLIFPLLEIVASLTIGIVIGIVLSLVYKRVIRHINKEKDLILETIVVSVLACVAIGGIYPIIVEPTKLNWLIDLNISNILVAMSAGCTFTNFIKKSDFEYSNSVVSSFTAPIFVAFFTLAAAHLRLNVFTQITVVVIAGGYILFRAIGKYFGVYLGATIAKSSPTIKKYMGFAMFPQAGVALGMAYAVSERFMSVIDPVTNVAVGTQILNICVAGVFVFELVGPLFAKFAFVKSKEINTEPDIIEPELAKA